MPRIYVPVFGGMIPALDDTLLPDNGAAYAENVWLYSGKMRGLPQPKLLHENDLTDVGKVYRIPLADLTVNTIFDSHFMEFVDANTDVIRAPVFDDTFERYYWVSPSQPPMYNTRARIINGDEPWLLGIPQPAAPSILVVGGSATAVTRSYVITWVSAYGEEGPPSDPVVVTDNPDGSWDITLPAVDADDDGDAGDDRYLTHVRIYRTVVSSSGVATFFLVAEQVITDTTYSDTAADDDVTPNDQLESTDWTAPPTDLQGWTMMPNGIMAGFRDNELWFSEPYRPHAWPVKYVLTVEHTIVGLGVTNQMLVVGTYGNPVTATGVSPAYITTSRLSALEPCLSRGSIVASAEGVYYASANGLVLVTPGKAENITRELITRDVWQRITKNSALQATRLGTAYYAFGTALPGAFQEDAFQTDLIATEDFAQAFGGMLIDPFNQQVAFSHVTSDLPVFGVQADVWTGEVFILKDNAVYWVDQGDPLVPLETAIWRSKIYQEVDRRNYAAVKIYFEVEGEEPDNYGTFKVYADGVLVATKPITVSGQMMRLPSGFQSSFWQFEIETQLKILNVQMATSAKELRAM